MRHFYPPVLKMRVDANAQSMQFLIDRGITGLNRLAALKAAVPYAEGVPSPVHVACMGAELEEMWRYQFNRSFIARSRELGFARVDKVEHSMEAHLPLPAYVRPEQWFWSSESYAWSRIMKHVSLSPEALSQVRKLWRIRKTLRAIDRVIKRVCRQPAGTAGGGQFMACGGSSAASTGSFGLASHGYINPVSGGGGGGGGSGVWTQPPMPTGTAPPLRGYVRAMGELKSAIEAGDVARILGIKGPPASHNYGKRFEQYRMEGAAYVRNGGRIVLQPGGSPAPAPAPPVAPKAPVAPPAPAPAGAGATTGGGKPYGSHTVQPGAAGPALEPTLGPRKFNTYDAFAPGPDAVVNGAVRKSLEFVAQVHDIPDRMKKRDMVADALRTGSSSWGMMQYKVELNPDPAAKDANGRTLSYLKPKNLLLQRKFARDTDEIETVLHEFGHALDTHGNRKLLGSSYGVTAYGSGAKPTKAHRELMDAINDSEAGEFLNLNSGKSTSNRTGQHQLRLSAPEAKYVKYLNSPQEKFARAYAQWIMTKHVKTNPAFRTHLDAHSSSGKFKRQWKEQDFEPISKAFDKLAQELGWTT